jgi:1-acyl-sn-glycerol-3-phosphate acyltransferase/long-chain acyl-CoA synthetase
MSKLVHILDHPTDEPARSAAESLVTGAVDTFRSTLALVVRGYLAAYHRLEIIGRENLPADGAFVMVSNHASHLDALCLRAALPRQRLAQSFTAVAEDYFMTSAFRRTAARVFANAVPFSRHVRVKGGMRRLRTVLGRRGAILIFFPEGTRTRDGNMGPFRPGIGALLAGSNLPVVPVAAQGTFAAWPKGQRIARPRKLRVVIGRPRRFDDLPRNHAAYQAIADELRSAVEAMRCS